MPPSAQRWAPSSATAVMSGARPGQAAWSAGCAVRLSAQASRFWQLKRPGHPIELGDPGHSSTPALHVQLQRTGGTGTASVGAGGDRYRATFGAEIERADHAFKLHHAELPTEGGFKHG